MTLYNFVSLCPGDTFDYTLSSPYPTTIASYEGTGNYSTEVPSHFCLSFVVIRVVTQMPIVAGVVGRYSRTACTDAEYLFLTEKVLYSFVGLT